MVAAFLSYNNQRAISATLWIPEAGLWVCDLVFDAAADLNYDQNASTAVVSDLTLIGTLDPDNSGSYVSTGKARIVGGDGWRKRLPAQPFHNDAGVKISHVINSTAAASGETFADAPSTSLGADFTRRQQSGAATLNQLLDSAWYVDAVGVTRPGARPTTTLTSADYQLLDYDPVNRIATLSTETVSKLQPGATITDLRLPATLQIRELELTVTAKGLRAAAWVRTL